MVRVITIMDDVYDELSRIKKAKAMSFSEVLRYLLKEKKGESGIIGLAGSIEEKDLKRRAMDRIARGEYEWV